MISPNHSELFRRLYTAAMQREHSAICSLYQLRHRLGEGVKLQHFALTDELQEIRQEFLRSTDESARRANPATDKIRYRCPSCGRAGCLESVPVLFVSDLD